MSVDTTNVDALAALSDNTINERLQAAWTRAASRVARADDENRDLTDTERDLNYRDHQELSALRDAVEVRSARREYEQRCQQVAAATEAHGRSGRLSPLAVSAEHLEQLEQARRDYRSLTVVETRGALTTTLLGTATEYGAGGLQAPNTLWRLSGIPTTEPPSGYNATVPTFTLPVGAALVSEGNPHAEFDDVAPDPVTLGRAGAWSDLTAEGNVSTPLSDISSAHARIIARDLDLALVAKLEDTAGAYTIDEALTTVAAEAAADVSQLWIVGSPVDVAGLAGNANLTPASGPDVGSYASRYGGARLYSTPAASEGLTVFYPGGFRCFATALASGVVVDPTTGAQRFGQWMLFGVGQSLAGSAVTVAGVGSA